MTRAGGQIIVVGNEKGGSGKSTTAIHLIVGFLRAGLSVASVDLDGRQGTLTRFLALRERFAERNGLRIPVPTHELVAPAGPSVPGDASRPGDVAGMVATLASNHDAVVVDTPGSDSDMSRLAHSLADTLVTPLNDSFVDFDVLAVVDPETMQIERPSHYAEMVWEQRKQRARRDGGTIDWIVMRNRLSSLDAVSKREMARLLDDMGRRFGFRQIDGFGERVIYRELFFKGLTIMDVKEAEQGGEGMRMSHVAARQEVRTLVEAVRRPVRQSRGA